MKPFKFNSSDEILEKLEAVDKISSASFDGKILATIMEFIINFGFKLEEFGELKIRNVIDSQGNVKWPFASSQPNPFEEFRESIDSHLAYLKDKGFSVNKKAPLFPQLMQNKAKHESPGYQSWELRRDLKEQAGTTWEELRRDGIHHYYQGAKKQGFEDNEVVDYLANLFREEKNYIIETLTKGGIKLSGVEKERAVKTLPIKAVIVGPKKQMIGGGEKKNDSKKTNISVLWNTENEDPFKDFDDGDTENGYCDDDED